MDQPRLGLLRRPLHPARRGRASSTTRGSSERGRDGHDYDVVVIGAGRRRAARRDRGVGAGARTALVCKSLLGKAHTVMAEGGIAAALGNVDPADELADALPGHALRRQVPEQLARWRSCTRRRRRSACASSSTGARVFDRTPDRADVPARRSAATRTARLVHIGDRTGLELIRTLQDKAVHRTSTSSWSARSRACSKDGDRVCGRVRLLARDRRARSSSARGAVVLATGGAGKC